MVTIADVARHAGVAASTVSYVLSGKRSISSDTRERVQRSVRALGYRPNASARALASQRSNVLALVIPLRTGMHVPVMMQFAAAVVTTARRYDHDVLLLTADEGPEGLQRVAQSSLVDALVVMDVELDDERVPVLRELPMPSVLIGYPADSEGLTCIDLDFVAAGARCVDHLADLGHRSMALLGTPSAVYERQTGFAQRTLTGFAEAAGQRGVVGVETPCEHTFAAVLGTVERLLHDHPDLTGLVVQNEPIIGPLLDVLRRLGRRVPEDMSLVAICADDVAERQVPQLSSVTIPAERIGALAVESLITKLSGAEAPELTLLPPEFTARGSSGRADDSDTTTGQGERTVDRRA
ncbi:LacI family transcriptional regulator [Kribbella turkmenica]|uniref:LacI family transcriptional regulator n=1 Tax=Kribbella turkmenica TaxID=2530375 RepID=A0A4R4XFI7_9ACTN|nr:LacI family DNA-binding transcriptional regulator [Kribbella turkmenica]TDD29671.1 LacI family transcriptional regulator [Kribbella turkmenica]